MNNVVTSVVLWLTLIQILVSFPKNLADAIRLFRLMRKFLSILRKEMRKHK